jgi:hypothetical protein
LFADVEPPPDLAELLGLVVEFCPASLSAVSQTAPEHVRSWDAQ